MLIPSRASKKAFTLLELIVVIVILGLLAALAIPTFARVTKRSQDASTSATISAVLRDTRALMAFGDTTWKDATETSVKETSAPSAAGLAAAAMGVRDDSANTEPTSTSEAVYSLLDGGVVVSMLSKSGNVCLAGASLTSATTPTCAPPRTDGKSSAKAVGSGGTMSDGSSFNLPVGAASPAPTNPAPVTPAPAVPNPGTFVLSTALVGSKPSLTWSASADAASYRVERSSTSDFVSPVVLVASTTALTHTDAAATTGTWYYRVTAVGAAGSTPRIQTASVVVEPTYSFAALSQFGGPGEDVPYDMAEAADGTIYVAGYTNGPLDGATAGTYDAFLRAVNPDGSVKWTRQLGSTGGDIGYSVAVAPNGNVYLVGEAGTVLPGSTQVGAFDAFIAAYSPAGSRLWVKQFGTAAGDVAQAVTVGPDSTAYVTGFVTGALTGTHAGLYDTFVRAYSSSGAVSWTTQFGSDKHDIPYGIARGADGTLYIGGSTEGSLPNGGRSNASGTDGYLVALSSSGSLSWTRQFGTASQDEVRDVTVSGSTVYVGGRTYGVLGSSSAGGQDGFLAGYSTSGDQLWLTQFGTPVSDSLSKIAAAPDGSLWVSGGTAGSLGGTSAGGNDGFLTRFSASGQMAGSSQYGTPSHDFATALTVTSSGVPYVALQTSGAVVGNSAGSIDVALLRLNAS